MKKFLTFLAGIMSAVVAILAMTQKSKLSDTVKKKEAEKKHLEKEAGTIKDDLKKADKKLKESEAKLNETLNKNKHLVNGTVDNIIGYVKRGRS